MKICFSHFRIALLLVGFLVASVSYAQTFNKDVYIKGEDISFPADITPGETIRLYATVHNDSDEDLKGLVRFYDERLQQFMGTDQPFSAVAHNTDTVFVDFSASEVGSHPVAVRIIPWEESEDNPDNNKVVAPLIVDRDTDSDGTGDRADSDDDNDGVKDRDDAFSLNPKESEDADKDGLGNNEDTDDDNDGVPDTQDVFPLDPAESKDRDQDGVGDQKDLFPEDPKESKDSDDDGLGDNADPNDSNQGPLVIMGISSSDREVFTRNDTSPEGALTQPRQGRGYPLLKGEGQARLQGAADITFVNPDTLPKGIVGEPITFNALRSFDPDGEVMSATWDFGDGEKTKGLQVSHIFAKEGDYKVLLTVTDNQGESRELSTSITVKPVSFLKWWMMPVFLLFLVFLALVSGKCLQRRKK